MHYSHTNVNLAPVRTPAPRQTPARGRQFHAADLAVLELTDREHALPVDRLVRVATLGPGVVDVRLLPNDHFGGAQIARWNRGALSGATEPRKDSSVSRC